MLRYRAIQFFPHHATMSANTIRIIWILCFISKRITEYFLLNLFVLSFFLFAQLYLPD